MRIFVLIAAIIIAVSLFAGYAAIEVYGKRSLQTEKQVAAGSIKVPAIDKNGEGALAEIRVKVLEGRGEVFLNIDEGKPLLNPETQQSIKTAFRVAREYSEIELADKDVYFEISGGSELVTGRSAGAAAAILAISVLRGERLRGNALITGSVDEDGKIGRVGRMLEKARVMKELGYVTLFVPPGERIQSILPGTCYDEGGKEISGCLPKREEVDVAEETGLEIIEVVDIAEAYRLMRG